MATTDLHLQVLPYDYQTGLNADGQGLARTATLIRNARREVCNCILVDNGDFLCGTTADAIVGKYAPQDHPMLRIMNHLGYDAATPGNHDFDHGLDFLQQVTAQANFPFVSANALTRRAEKAADDQSLYPRFTILERKVTDLLGGGHVLRIGITGFLPPHSIARYPANGQPVQTRDIIEAARAVIPEMKAAGADIIIALAHTGIGCEEHVHDMENAAIPLARLDGIDAIISGHRHQVFPGPDWPASPAIDARRGTVHGKPLVSAGFWGSHLGLIDLELVLSGETWTLQRHRCEARPVFTDAKAGSPAEPVESDAKVSEIIRPTHESVLDWVEKPVGRTRHALNSFFALVAPSRAVQVVQRAQSWYVQQHFCGLYDPARPLLSSSCSFKSGGYGGPANFTNVAAGILSQRGLCDLYPFPNQIALLEIDGQALREWLERAASVFNTARPGPAPNSLKPADIPAYMFESVLGVDYTIDLTQPARYNQTGCLAHPDNRRIKNLAHRGQPVTSDQKFTLITNNYRLGGGGGYPDTCLQNPLTTPAVVVQDILAEYFRAHPDLGPELAAHWHFAPAGGNVRMSFRSAPDALGHMDGLCGRDIRPLSVDDSGYQIFELRL